VVAGLVREGARQFAARRRLTPREEAVLMAVEQAAFDARGSAYGTAAVPAAVAPASSSVTVDQAAEVLRVSTSMVRRLCRAGQLAAQRRGSVWWIDGDSLAELALSRRRVA
jgi:excisionase family DNA binding protein